MKINSLRATGPFEECHIVVELLPIEMRDRVCIDEYRLFSFETRKLYGAFESELDLIRMLNRESRDIVTFVSKVL